MGLWQGALFGAAMGAVYSHQGHRNPYIAGVVSGILFGTAMAFAARQRIRRHVIFWANLGCRLR